MTKYIAYCRKSTDEKDKQIMSIEQQIDELKSFAQRANLEISEFLTEAETAKVPGRPVFNHLISLIEKGLINGIISWHPDRLARNSIDGGKIIYLIDTGKLQSMKFPSFWFENTPQGKFMLSIAFGQSKYYVDNLSENVKRGLYFKLRRGEWPSYAPLGYKNDRNTRSVMIEPRSARLVKESFQKFASGEFSSMKDIRSLFFKNGIARRNGKPLHFNQIREMLQRTFYFGLMTCHGETYEGKHKPLITKKLFDEVQKVLEKKYNRKPEKHDFAFTGFIKCGECGSFFTAEKHKKFYPKTRGEVWYTYYRCVKKKGVCSQKYLREEELEKQLREIVLSVSLSEIQANKLLEMAKRDGEKEKEFAVGELQKLSFSLTDLEKKLDKLLESYLEEIIDTESYQKKKEELLQIKKDLQEKIEEIKTKGSSWLEPMKEFIKEAALAAKIARAKNNCKDLAIFAKKVGSNYFLKDKRLEFSLSEASAALAAPALAASAYPSDLLLCLYFTKLAPIFKTNDVARAERMVALTKTVRSDSAPRPLPSVAVQNQKFSFLS